MRANEIRSKFRAHMDAARELREIDIPEVGATVYFRSPTVADIEEIFTGMDMTDQVALSFRACHVLSLDENGARIWPKPESDDWKMGIDPALAINIVERMGALKKLATDLEASIDDEDPT